MYTKRSPPYLISVANCSCDKALHKCNIIVQSY